MLSEELEQAKTKFLLDIKEHPRMDCGRKAEECLALRTIYHKDDDMPHALWANYELRKALNEEIKRPDLSPTEVKKMLKSYWQTFLFAAPYDFHSYLLYMEKDREPEKKFYPPRMMVLRPIVQDLQDLADGKLNIYGLSMPPGTAKSTTGILYMTWLMGRNPDMPSLASAYADKLCRSFYDGAMSFMKDPEYKFNEIFPDSPIAITNAKDETIDLARQHRFKTLTCRSIDGGLTGATRCESLLYADDMVSGSEEALNRDRMDTLWTKFTNDLMSRMKENCKMLVIGTRWSVWDPLGRLEAQYEGKKKAKFVKIPALDINGNSNFEYKYGVGFSTKHFKMLKDSMDDISWRSIYQQEPIEREGVLYHEDDLQYFNGDLPKDKEPDAIVAVCDSKGQGRDYVSAPCGVIYGDLVYIPAWVFNNGLPDVTKPLVANMCLKHNVSRLDVEMNNGGDYYADGVNQLIRGGGGYTSIREFFTSTNKITKIVTESDFVKKHFVFLNPQSPNTPKEYKDAMRNVLGFTVTGKSKHDDAPDSLAMLSQLVKDLSGMEVRIVDRRSLPL
jgi:predicted phage terminase large subunit-like protein